MSSNTTLIQKWFDEVWNGKRKEASIDEMMSQDCKIYGMDGANPTTRDDLKIIWRHYLKTFPDIHFEIIHLMENEDSVALYVKVTGTDAETNKPVCFYGTSMAKLRDGKLVEVRETWDFVTMLTQLGILGKEFLPKQIISTNELAEA